MPILEAKNVTKSFGALTAVDDVSFAVEEGKMFGIAGPNGSGKSTLFNTLTGIPFGPDAGDVIFDGRSIAKMPAHEIARLGLTRTFQKDAEFPTLSALDNILVGAVYLENVGAKEGMERAKVYAEVVGLPMDRLDEPAGNLSVFEKKLLMLASALVGDPRALLLDEPASGLTKPEVQAFDDILRKVNEGGVTIVLIEHILPLLVSISESLMVLDYGRVIARGEPHEVLRDPAVVEAYLGNRKAA